MSTFTPIEEYITLADLFAEISPITEVNSRTKVYICLVRGGEPQPVVDMWVDHATQDLVLKCTWMGMEALPMTEFASKADKCSSEYCMRLEMWDSLKGSKGVLTYASSIKYDEENDWLILRSADMKLQMV